MSQIIYDPSDVVVKRVAVWSVTIEEKLQDRNFYAEVSFQQMCRYRAFKFITNGMTNEQIVNEAVRLCKENGLDELFSVNATLLNPQPTDNF